MISDCEEKDGDQILEILNEAIANTTALYDYKPRAAADMEKWFAAKRAGNFPIVGFFGEGRRLLGFGSYGTFRNWPAYKYSVEHSVYVGPAERGKGLGRKILAELIARAQSQGYHTLIGGIDSANAASLRLHAGLGFENAGVIRHAGFKFGRWLDLVFVQKILPTPAAPADG